MVERRLKTAFYAGACLLFGWILISVMLEDGRNLWKYAVVAGLVFGGLFAFGRLAPAWLEHMPQAAYRVLVVGLWAGIALVGGYLVYQYRQYFLLDMKWVYEAVGKALEDGRFTSDNWYFVTYENQFGLAMLLYGLYWVAGQFGIFIGSEAALNLGVYCNWAVLLASMGLVVSLVKRWCPGRTAEVGALLLCAGYPVFTLWAPVFYTDTLSVFAPLLAMWLYDKWAVATGWRKKLLLAAAIAATVFVGYALKGSVAVVLVACAIGMLLEHKFGWKSVVSVLLMVALFVLLLCGYKLAYRHSPLLDFSVEDSVRLPLAHWLVFGSHGDGMWNADDFYGLLEYERSERNEQAWQLLKKYYGSYSAGELVQFMSSMQAKMWGNGKFGADDVLGNAYAGSWVHYYLLRGFPYYPYFHIYCEGYHLMTLGALLAVLISGLVPKSKPRGSAFLCSLILFGAAVFFTFWEKTPRYLINFSPLLVLSCAWLWLQTAVKPALAK